MGLLGGSLGWAFFPYVDGDVQAEDVGQMDEGDGGGVADAVQDIDDGMLAQLGRSTLDE